MNGTQLTQPVVLLNLEFHLWGLTRNVKRDEVEISGTNGDEVPEEALKLSKRLVKCDEYDAIVKADSETRRRVAELSLPFKRGVYAIPMKLVRRVVEILQEREAVREAEVDRFVSAYDGAVAQAEKDLGPLYRAKEYPSRGDVRASFAFQWTFVELQAAGGLKEISQSLYEDQERRLAEEWQRSTETMRESLRVAFAGLVGSLRERLDGERKGGKAKVFRDTRVENLRKWVGLFADRNVTGDGELGGLVEQADKLLTGVSAQDLRDDAACRKHTAEALKDIEQSVSTLVVAEGPKRKFRLSKDAD